MKHINKCHIAISDYLITCIKNGKMIDSAEREVNLNNSIIIFSVSLEESDDKIISKSNMGFTTDDDNDDILNINMDKIVSKNITDAVDTVVRFNNLTQDDLDFIYNNNVNDILSMYNNVNIDMDALKKEVFNTECKNGNDVINRLTSIIPKMIFNQVQED